MCVQPFPENILLNQPNELILRVSQEKYFVRTGSKVLAGRVLISDKNVIAFCIYS